MGCGVVASYGHIPAIQRTAGLTLRSIFEPDAGRMMDAKAKFNVEQGYTDVDAFFASGIDAVVVTSPAPAHLENVRLAAKYRKPVLCEKPLAMNEADSQTMVDLMRDAGMPLFVGFNYRFAPCALEIKRLVREGAIGNVRSLRLIYNWDCHGKWSPRDSVNHPNLHREGRMLEGGPMVDCGVHQIDLARWWLGTEIVSHHGEGVWVDEYAAPDHMYLHLEHAGGAHTMVEISYSFAHTSRDQRVQFVYELIGTDGVIRYDRQARIFEVVNRQGTQQLPWFEEKNFEGMYEEFLRALKTGESGNLPTGADGVLATRVARVATEEAMAKHLVTAAHPT